MRIALYWDASAILSAIYRDAHTDRALSRLVAPGLHILSTLAHAEACAVLARLGRADPDAIHTLERAHDALETGTWTYVRSSPRLRRRCGHWHVAAPGGRSVAPRAGEVPGGDAPRTRGGDV